MCKEGVLEKVSTSEQMQPNCSWKNRCPWRNCRTMDSPLGRFPSWGESTGSPWGKPGAGEGEVLRAPHSCPLSSSPGRSWGGSEQNSAEGERRNRA